MPSSWLNDMPAELRLGDLPKLPSYNTEDFPPGDDATSHGFLLGNKQVGAESMPLFWQEAVFDVQGVDTGVDPEIVIQSG